jgi:acetyl-CoA decarbonylase/synthase complex subunit gamma
MARLTALQLYKYLPAKNCGKCDEATCMAFAIQLLERKKKAFDCPELTDEGLNRLIDVLTSPVRDVEFGVGENVTTVGGEEVMYRHELRFYSPTPFFMDVSDLMTEKEIKERISFVKDFEIERIGMKLRLQGIAVRCASNDPKKFKKVVGRVKEGFPGALILCSFNPDALEAGMEVVGDRKPLLYAADRDNWERVLEIALRYHTPMVVYSNSLDELGTLTREISARGFKDIILDPGVESGDSGLARTLNRFVMLRKSAVKGVKELGYPLMGSTAVIWMNPKEKDEMKTAYHESTMASMLLDRFASLLILHSINLWSTLPLVTLRQNIYTDPRVEPTVESKLYEIGSPDENSPVFITTNFALTYFSVSGDMEGSKISCHLLVVDTEGLAVTVSVAAEKITASSVKKALKESGIGDKVKHHKLIIPGVMARLKGELEDATGWDILIGPQDSSQIADFLRNNWT